MMSISEMPPTEPVAAERSAGFRGSVGRRGEVWLIAVALAALTVWTYWPVWNHEFVAFDDHEYVVENPHVQAGLSWAGVKWALSTTYFSYWHPLTWLSHMLDAELFGSGPRGPHAMNLGIHIVNTLLVLMLLRRITGSVRRSAVVAALFALHPLHVESVAWVSERKDVLSAFFFLLTMWAYARYVAVAAGVPACRVGSGEVGRQGRLPLRVTWYCSALLLFACGLMSKPMVVTLPCVLLLLDYWPFRRTGFKYLLWEKLPFFVVTAAVSAVTFFSQRSNDVVQSLTAFSWSARLENALVAYGSYLAKTVWPENLAFFYPHPGDWSASAVAASLVAVGGLTVFALTARKKLPFAPVGWLWFLGMLVPTIGIVQVGGQAMADRYTYLPHLGLFIAVVWSAAALATRSSGRVACVMAAIVAIGAAAVASRNQTIVWRNSESLFRHAVAVTEDNFVAHNNLGNLLVAQGRIEEGIEQYRRALSIRADDDHAATNLGTALLRLGRTEDAIAQFERAVAVNPDLLVARYALSAVLLDTNRGQAAIPHLQRIVAVEPGNGQAHFDLGSALRDRSDPAALAHLQRAADLLDTTAAHYEAGALAYQRGEFADAVRHLDRVVELEPDDSEARNNLGSALLRAGRTEEARTQFERALAGQPDAAVVRQNLAITLVRLGRPREAIEHYQRLVTDPSASASVLTEMAWLRATAAESALRDGNEAVRLAQRAVDLTEKKDAMALRALAAGFAETGQFAVAAEIAGQALNRVTETGDGALRAELQAHLATYRIGRPVRDPIALSRNGEDNQL